MQINLSWCRTSNHYLLYLQQLSWDLLGTKNVSPIHLQNFWKVNKPWQKKTCGRNNTNQLAGQTEGKKKTLELSDCLYVVPVLRWRVKKSPNGQYPQSAKLVSNKLFKCSQLVRGLYPLFQVTPPPFSKIFPFLEIQDAPTFYKPIRKTNVVNDSFNQFVYKFHPKSILILEEQLLKW